MSDQQIQKVKVRHLARVGLWSADVVTQARFYCQALGLDLRATSEVVQVMILRSRRPICSWGWAKSNIAWVCIVILD